VLFQMHGGMPSASPPGARQPLAFPCLSWPGHTDASLLRSHASSRTRMQNVLKRAVIEYLLVFQRVQSRQAGRGKPGGFSALDHRLKLGNVLRMQAREGRVSSPPRTEGHGTRVQPAGPTRIVMLIRTGF